MLNVQKYLIENKGSTIESAFEKLKSEFAIKYKLYPEDGLVILNYDQIESPKSHPIVIECRSLILCPYTFGVVSRKFDRFFNHGECPDFYHDFDLSRAYTFTKEDGSLIGVYHNSFTSKWEISTRSLAKAEGEHVTGGTFRDKVLSAFGFDDEQHFQNHMDEYAKELTYIFEYCGPSNRIVRRYENEEMILTAIRNNISGNYHDHDLVEHVAMTFQLHGLTVYAVESFPLHTIEEIKAAIDALPALEEGYVCFDPVSGKRVKLKSLSYLAVHGLRENGAVSMKRAYTLVLINDHEEYLVNFPEDQAIFDPVIQAVEDFKQNLENNWDIVKDISDQKEFALKVKDLHGSGVFFEAKKKQQHPVHVFNSMDESKKLRIFGF